MKSKIDYDKLISLLEQVENLKAQNVDLSGLIAVNTGASQTEIIRQRFRITREIASFEKAISEYPSDEVYLMKNAVWKFDEKRIKASFTTVKSKEFNNRDVNEPEEKREERLSGAFCFLLGYLIMTGKTTAVIALAIAGESGMSLAFGILLASGIFDKKNDNSYTK